MDHLRWLAEWLLNACPEASLSPVVCTGYTLRRRRWWHFGHKDADWLFDARGTCAFGDVTARMGVSVGSTLAADATSRMEQIAAKIRRREEGDDHA